MSLTPAVAKMAKDFKNHEDILVMFISVIQNKKITSALDLMISYVYELDSIRTELLQEYTNAFTIKNTLEEMIVYERFVEFLRNLNMMRCLCRKDLRALDLKFEACGSKVKISKGYVQHYDNETIVEHDGYMYIIDEGDDDLGCFIDFIMDDDGTLLERLAEDHTKFNKKIEREKIEDYKGVLS